MCRSITYRYRICTHSWRPHLILCTKPTANTTGKCLAHKIQYERRVIKSGNGYCAGCWERILAREERCRERERVLQGNMDRKVEVERARKLEEGVRRGERERKEMDGDGERRGLLLGGERWMVRDSESVGMRQTKEGEGDMRGILESERKERREKEERNEQRGQEWKGLVKKENQGKERKEVKHGWARKKGDSGFYII